MSGIFVSPQTLCATFGDVVPRRWEKRRRRLTRSIEVLYLTMRFSTCIKQIQNLRAYHAGDKLFVEVCLPGFLPTALAELIVIVFIGGHHPGGTHAFEGQPRHRVSEATLQSSCPRLRRSGTPLLKRLNSEVLTYFLESVPIVDRAFVHIDYDSYNVPTHVTT